jgi:hypothetical protein
MSKEDYRKARQKACELPRLDAGDVLLVGKFKLRKATITGIRIIPGGPVWDDSTRSTH